MNDNALYLETDEDITSAIDKLRKQSGGSVQIVVPKRSALLQSIINLKLLRKAADDERKELVIVTTDRVATELAARVGIAVAPAVGAHASLVAPKPIAPAMAMADDVVHGEEASTVPAVGSATSALGQARDERPAAAPLFTRREVGGPSPVGSAAPGTAGGAAAAAAAAAASDEAAEDPMAAAAAGSTTVLARRGLAGGTNKEPKVPNFSRLQHVVIWSIVALVLVGGYFAAMYFLTGANVTLFVAASKINIDSGFTIDPAAAASNPSQSALAGQTIKIEKDLTAPFTPTGQKDAGAKATGTVTVTNYCYNPGTLASGATFTYSGLKYTSTAAVAVPAAAPSGGVCTPTTAAVPVAAVQNGDSYNIAIGVTLTLTAPSAAYSASSYMTAKSAAQFTGGLTKTVTVVTQGDIDRAKAAALASDNDGSLKDLAAKLPADSIAIDGSQTQTAGAVTSTPAVDAEGTTASAAIHVIYTQLAIKKTDLQALLTFLAGKQAGAENQVYDNGFASAKIVAVQSSNDSGTAKAFRLTAAAYGGAKLNNAALVKLVVGKRYSDALDILGKQSGVQKVTVTMQPPWAGSLPSRADRIKISIKVSGIGK